MVLVSSGMCSKSEIVRRLQHGLQFLRSASLDSSCSVTMKVLTNIFTVTNGFTTISTKNKVICQPQLFSKLHSQSGNTQNLHRNNLLWGLTVFWDALCSDRFANGAVHLANKSVLLRRKRAKFSLELRAPNGIAACSLLLLYL